MTGWCRRFLVGVAGACAVLCPSLGAGPAGAVPPLDDDATVPTGVTTTTFADNDFIPEDVNLSDCISGVPRPGCGSQARSDWRQGLVFGVMAIGIAFIGWRIIRSVRRNRPDRADSEGQDEDERVSQ